MSKGLFGRPVRLLTAAWVASNPSPKFWQGEAHLGVKATAPRGLSVTPKDVIQELDRLIELKMLKSLPKVPGDRRVYYQRLKSPLWKIVETATACCV